MADKLISRHTNFSDWYTSICIAAKLFSYANVKGTINYLPYGWAIWQNIVDTIDKKLKKTGVQNVQLPLFIKTSDFAQEKEHIEGFAPEAFLVNNVGTEKISDPLIVRPTSEILFSQLFKQQIVSYNDLPKKYNQWCSVYRAEKNTKPFLRGCEFFWQELHAMFATKEECEKYVLDIHNLYNSFLEDVCAIPVLAGKKTEGEKFAGAVDTYTREVFSQDGQCIQTGTSHFLGQNFSKMFDVKFQDKQNNFSYPYYMSAGITTRLIGDIIVVHGDDKGLVLPFDLAPYQVSVNTIFADKNPNVNEKAKEIAKKLEKKYRVDLDISSSNYGFKITEKEVMGVPFSVFFGPKDLDNNTCQIYRRDTGEKINISLDELTAKIESFRREYYNNLFSHAKKHLDESIVEVNNAEELKNALTSGKIGLAYWCGEANEEKKIKETFSAAPRCVKKENVENKTCFLTGKPAKQRIYIARSY